jgi:hypothetical protein
MLAYWIITIIGYSAAALLGGVVVVLVLSVRLREESDRYRYQLRINGELLYYSNIDTALVAGVENGYDKVSFSCDGGRVILRRSGVWEVWTESGVYSAGRHKKWYRQEKNS